MGNAYIRNVSVCAKNEAMCQMGIFRHTWLQIKVAEPRSANYARCGLDLRSIWCTERLFFGSEHTGCVSFHQRSCLRCNAGGLHW